MRYSITECTVQQVKNVGATNIKVPHNIPVVFADLSKTQVLQLEASGATVTKVSGVKATVTPPVPVAAAPIYTIQGLIEATGFEDLRSLMTPLLYGEGFNAAVLDTGVRETHQMINGRVVYSKNFTSDPMRDDFDHGTGIASVIVAVAPKGNILNMKVLGDIGEGTEEEVVLAIADCISLHDTNPSIAPSIISLSLGTPDDGNPNSPLRVACRAAIEKGIWIEAAAGNSGPNPTTVDNPACEKYVFAIGSLSYDPFTISSFSSRGPTVEGLIKPDLTTFGEDIILASSKSDTATVAKSGTSFSTPFCSGALLLFHEAIARYGGVRYIGEAALPVTEFIAESVSIQDMMDVHLSRLCLKPGGIPAGKDNEYGWGLPFGPYIRDALVVGVAGLDLSSLLTAVIMIGMMGIMVKVVK